jgi:FSR family fosmidomycin resistance protein-like MFS transporter
LRWRSLVCLALIHTLVDSYAQVVTPLWPRLQKDFHLLPWGLTLLYAAWQMGTSVSQPFFGYWGDRFGSRWMVAVGPAIAVVCVTLIGFVPGPAWLFLLLALAGLGIGAFHPEAAAGVVEAAGTRAPQGLALFTFGGMLGLGIGPIVSGFLAEHYGLTGLAYALPPGLVLLLALVLLRQPVPIHRTHSSGHIGLREMLAGRGLAATLVLTVATLRVVPALGIPLGMAFLLDREGQSAEVIGRAQSLFLLSGGLGTLLCPLLVRPGRELAVLVGTILPAAGCLALLAWGHPWAYHVGLIGSGLLLQGSIPILISYSQRLLPRGQRIAASLTLGASWGLGGLIVAGLQTYFTATGHFEGMFWALLPFALAAALGSCLLPHVPAADPRRVVPSQPAIEPQKASA